jgi:opacity protein-like surface antigen
VGNNLLYASLGVSAASFTQSTPFGGGFTISHIVPGVTVGVGGEMPIGNNNTIRGQVEYTRYMTQRYTYIAPALFIDSTYSTVKATVGLTHYLK